MNLKDAAAQLNLSQSKTKEVCMVVLGSIPSEFLTEDLDKLKKHLALTGNNQQALISAVDSQVNGELVDQSPVKALSNDLKAIAGNGQKIAKLKQIVDGRSYQTNIKLWQGYISFQLNQALNQQQFALQMFIEQSQRLTAEAFDGMTDKLRREIKVNSRNWFEVITGDFTQELQALSELEVSLERSNSQYEEELRKAIDELMKLG